MEEVMARDPEVILLSAMLSSDSLPEQKKWWQRWREISAVRSGRIFAVEADLILRPSPRIVKGLEEIARALHPETFQKVIRYRVRERGFSAISLERDHPFT